MAEQVRGELTIDNSVIADLAGYAALECYGVVGMAAPTLTDGIAKLLPAARLRRGIVVESTPEGVEIDLFVVIESGTNIAAVSQNLAETVKYALQSCVPIRIAAINVHVQGIRIRD